MCGTEGIKLVGSQTCIFNYVVCSWMTGTGQPYEGRNEVRYFIIRKITPKVLISVVSKKLFPVLARVVARAQWCSGASGSAGASAVGFLAPHDESTQLLQKASRPRQSFEAVSRSVPADAPYTGFKADFLLVRLHLLLGIIG